MNEHLAIAAILIIAVAAEATRRATKAIRDDFRRHQDRTRRLEAIKAELNFIAESIAKARAEAFAAYMAGDLKEYRKARQRVNVLIRRLDREVNEPLAKLRAQ